MKSIILNLDAVYGYLCDLLQNEIVEKNRIFARDNFGHDSVTMVYSDGYMKQLGKELALREVIEYFDKLEREGKTDEKQIPKNVEPKPMPKVICLCGSTRFYDVFQKVNYELTMQGKIVLSVGFYPHSSEQAHGQVIGCTAEQKIALDELHKRKIDLCDSVLVLNVDGYIGESTKSEIEYAKLHNKAIKYLEEAEGKINE